MKKLLTILAAIGMSSTAAVSVVACGTVNQGPKDDNSKSSGEAVEQDTTFTTQPIAENTSIPAGSIKGKTPDQIAKDLENQYAVPGQNGKADPNEKVIISNLKIANNSNAKIINLDEQEDTAPVQISFDLAIQVKITNQVQDLKNIKVEKKNADGTLDASATLATIPEIKVPKQNNTSFTFSSYDANKKQVVYKTNLKSSDFNKNDIVWPDHAYTSMTNATISNGKLTIELSNDYKGTYGVNNLSFKYAPANTNSINFSLKWDGIGLSVSKSVLMAGNTITPTGNAYKQRDHEVTKALWNNMNQNLKDELTKAINLPKNNPSDGINNKYVASVDEFNQMNSKPFVGQEMVRNQDVWLKNGKTWWDDSFQVGKSYYVALNDWNADWNNQPKVATDVIKITITDGPMQKPESNLQLSLTKASVDSIGTKITINTTGNIVTTINNIDDIKFYNHENPQIQFFIKSVLGNAGTNTITIDLNSPILKTDKDLIKISGFADNDPLSIDTSAIQDNSSVELSSASVDSTGMKIIVNTKQDIIVKEININNVKFSKAGVDVSKDVQSITVSNDNKKQMTITLNSNDKLTKNTKNAILSINGFSRTHDSINIDTSNGYVPPIPQPTDNSQLSMENAVMDSTGTILTINVNGKIVKDVALDDITLNDNQEKLSVNSVQANPGTNEIIIKLNSPILKTDKASIAIKGFSNKASLSIDTSAIQDNSSVELSSATVDSTGIKITVNTKQDIIVNEININNVKFSKAGADVSKDVQSITVSKDNKKQMTIMLKSNDKLTKNTKDAVLSITGFSRAHNTINIDTSNGWEYHY